MRRLWVSPLHRRGGGGSVHLLHAPEHVYHPGEDAVLQLQEPPGGHGGEPDADGDREEGRLTNQMSHPIHVQSQTADELRSG